MLLYIQHWPTKKIKLTLANEMFPSYYFFEFYNTVSNIQVWCWILHWFVWLPFPTVLLVFFLQKNSMVAIHILFPLQSFAFVRKKDLFLLFVFLYAKDVPISVMKQWIWMVWKYFSRCNATHVHTIIQSSKHIQVWDEVDSLLKLDSQRRMSDTHYPTLPE